MSEHASESVSQRESGIGFDQGWLALREPADSDARAEELVEALRARLRTAVRSAGEPIVVHDLGSGTGSLARWLAPRLPGPQRWVLHDHDAALLDAAVRATRGLRDADGGAVEVAVRGTDLGALRGTDLDGAAVVVASALLDVLTPDDMERLAAVCATAGCPALLTLTVTGQVVLDPPDPLDARVAAAFDAHQRRTVAGRRLLGPDAVDVAAGAFRRCGMTVRQAPSPWRLGPQRAELAAEWLRGRVAAARDERPDLAGSAGAYLERRLRASAVGDLTAVVHHQDLFATPVEVAAS